MATVNEILQAKPGDIIQLSNGKTCRFVKMNRTRWRGVQDGVTYDYSTNMFIKVIGHEDVVTEVKLTETPAPNYNAVDRLEAGDWFYIKHRDKALCFTFVRYDGDKIIGVDPITNGQIKIAKSLFVARIVT